MSDLSILYQDETLIAINKPPGLLVHRSPIDKKETRFAVQQLRDQIGRHVFPVHRLDRPTSGVLLFTYSGDTASQLGIQLMQKQVKKQYAAVVRGHMRGTGFIDYPLKYRYDKFADKDKKRQLAPQAAQSEYTAVRRYELPYPSGRYPTSRFSLIMLSPLTGRKHQLRRHCAHVRHPILGDTTHGDGKQNKFLRETFTFENLALSCTQLGIFHPDSGKWTEITSPVHDAMQALLHRWAPWQVD